MYILSHCDTTSRFFYQTHFTLHLGQLRQQGLFVWHWGGYWLFVKPLILLWCCAFICSVSWLEALIRSHICYSYRWIVRFSSVSCSLCFELFSLFCCSWSCRLVFPLYCLSLVFWSTYLPHFGSFVPTSCPCSNWYFPPWSTSLYLFS